jgi:hypothetical protein
MAKTYPKPGAHGYRKESFPYGHTSLNGEL